MLGDFLTKPKQGTAFRKFRNQALNLTKDKGTQYLAKDYIVATDELTRDALTRHRSVLGNSGLTERTKDGRAERAPQIYEDAIQQGKNVVAANGLP